MTNLMEVFQGNQDHPALFQERDVLESLPPQMIRDFIQECEFKEAELAQCRMGFVAMTATTKKLGMTSTHGTARYSITAGPTQGPSTRGEAGR